MVILGDQKGLAHFPCSATRLRYGRQPRTASAGRAVSAAVVGKTLARTTRLRDVGASRYRQTGTSTRITVHRRPGPLINVFPLGKILSLRCRQTAAAATLRVLARAAGTAWVVVAA
jgi:hypothetical protein